MKEHGLDNATGTPTRTLRALFANGSAYRAICHSSATSTMRSLPGLAVDISLECWWAEVEPLPLVRHQLLLAANSRP